MLEEAVSIYRSSFQPSDALKKPHVMIAAGICAAESDAEADFLRSSQMLAFANLRTGKPGKLPGPTHDVTAEIPALVLSQVTQALSCSAVGSPKTIRKQLSAIIEKYQPDELIVTGMINDHMARIRSFEIAADILAELIDPANVE